MRILHTADWHLGKRLESFSRLEEQKAVLQEICEIADTEKVDVILIAGDLFDTYNPATEAVELFYKTLRRLSKGGFRPVVAIAGNHDSPERIEAPDPLARACGIFFAGFPDTQIADCQLETGVSVETKEPGLLEIKLPAFTYPLRLLLTPYANEYRLRTCFEEEESEEELRKLLEKQWKLKADKYCDALGVNILLAHLFFAEKGKSLQEEPEDEKPILHMGGAQAIFTENIPEQIQYTALGHLHRYQVMGNLENPVVYSSSPLAYSFSEANQDKFVVVIDAEPGKPVKRNKIKLEKGRKLLRKRFEDIPQCVKWLRENQDALVELTIVTDEFLSGTERKQLYEVHGGIVTIIPEVKNKEILHSGSGELDLGQDMEALFKTYFFSRQGQAPNEEILDLFKEILSEETE